MMLRPRFATTTGLRLLLLALAVSDTSAIFCDFYHDRLDGVTVSSQEEVDRKYAGCTEIDGSVTIATNYTGRFYFPNVTYMTGGIHTVYDYYDAQKGNEMLPSPLLTSIEVPDLNNTGVIDINGVPALTSISFPSLTVVNGSIYLAGIEDCLVDFPSLKTTEVLLVTGNSTRLNFPKLADGGYMRVSRNPGRSDDNDYDNILLVDRVDQIPLDINFPALEVADNIYLQGNISSLSMPLLYRVGDWEQYYNRFIRILTHGNPLNISLPSLYDFKDISVAGTIGSISFPVLKDIERFQINTSTPLNVTLEPIQTISQYLRLVGNVTEISLSTITKLDNLKIDSSSNEFYCSSIASDFERIVGRKMKYYECTGHPPKSKLPLILGLSIGLGVPIISALVCYMCWKRRKTKKGQALKSNKPPEYELGVPPTYTADGLPTYDASEEGRSEEGAADVAGARAGDGSSVRGEGASEHSAGDAAGARPGDGNSGHQEGADGRRVV
ncbi:hypothetical protein V502_10532 [Pseudogymnoascus sp. VKM F-4520 (FW-2644)]|nr:hypothetical protein V502_10532 [Pseudogymnoascus sp. VKM F-4520 (FW-2644)]